MFLFLESEDLRTHVQEAVSTMKYSTHFRSVYMLYKPHLRESFVVPFSLLHMLHVLFQVWGGFRSGLHEFGVAISGWYSCSS